MGAHYSHLTGPIWGIIYAEKKFALYFHLAVFLKGWKVKHMGTGCGFIMCSWMESAHQLFSIKMIISLYLHNPYPVSRTFHLLLLLCTSVIQPRDRDFGKQLSDLSFTEQLHHRSHQSCWSFKASGQWTKWIKTVREFTSHEARNTWETQVCLCVCLCVYSWVFTVL